MAGLSWLGSWAWGGGVELVTFWGSNLRSSWELTMPPKPSNISNITNQIACSIWVGLRLFSPIWVDFIYLGWIFGLDIWVVRSAVLRLLATSCAGENTV